MKIAKPFSGNLDEALKKWPDHLYVRNAVQKENMVILMDIRDTTGKVNCIKIPKTWIPVDLFDYVDKDSIIRSVQLRNNIRTGILKLVDADDAQEILETKEAQEEAERCGVRNSHRNLTEGEESPRAKVIDAPQQNISTEEKNFYEKKLDLLENEKIEAEANKIVADVVGNFASDASPELYANEKVVNAIKAMRDIADAEHWEKATKQLDEVINMIASNSPKS